MLSHDETQHVEVDDGIDDKSSSFARQRTNRRRSTN
jgi:hypothetical protein